MRMFGGANLARIRLLASFYLHARVPQVYYRRKVQREHAGIAEKGEKKGERARRLSAFYYAGYESVAA